MKIAYLMQVGVPDIRYDPPSGPALHVKHVVEELRRLGHHVSLLAFLEKGVWKSNDLRNFSPVAIPAIDSGILKLAERSIRRLQYELQLPYAALFESLRFALACCQELRGYDLFYERLGWVGYGAGLAAHWLHIPLILEVNGDHLSEMELQGEAPQGCQRMLSMMLMKNAAHRAAHTVTTGEGWRKLYIERWKVDPASVTVIENGSELVKLIDRSRLRTFSPNSVSNNILTIAYSGGFDPWQGVTILLHAVCRVIATGIAVRLLLIGAGPGLAPAKQLAHDLGIEHQVVFTGQLASNEYAAYLTTADIGVSPYCGRAEYSGLKLLDYKAAGLAIIASGKEGQPAIIEHGRTGLIVPPCDEDALYEAIIHLNSNRDFAARLGKEARLEAERLHSWENTAKHLIELFTLVTGKYDGNRRVD